MSEEIYNNLYYTNIIIDRNINIYKNSCKALQNRSSAVWALSER